MTRRAFRSRSTLNARDTRSWTLTTLLGDLDLVFEPPGTNGYPDVATDATLETVSDSPRLVVQVASLHDIIRMKQASGRREGPSHSPAPAAHARGNPPSAGPLTNTKPRRPSAIALPSQSGPPIHFEVWPSTPLVPPRRSPPSASAPSTVSISLGEVERLPYSIKVLLEAALRHLDGLLVTEEDVRALAGYDATAVGEVEIPFIPGRVVLQDFTGVPAVVDLAAMRSAVVRMTGDEASAAKVNPTVPCDLVIDHSVQVDAFNSGMALAINAEPARVRAQQRAVRVPQVGPVGVQQLQGRPARHRHGPPGQP